MEGRREWVSAGANIHGKCLANWGHGSIDLRETWIRTKRGKFCASAVLLMCRSDDKLSNTVNGHDSPGIHHVKEISVIE